MMADEIDALLEREAPILNAQIAAARKPIPEGHPGVCTECGEERPRLVGGVCAFCRDGR